MTPRVADKAVALLDQQRVHVNGRVARVYGDTGQYEVIATPLGVVCSCPAGLSDTLDACSHKVAAMVAWAEQRFTVVAG